MKLESIFINHLYNDKEINNVGDKDITTEQYSKDAIDIIKRIDYSQVEAMINILLELRENKGRLFFLGVGGGAGNCSHALNDFRKIAGIEAYTPVDNVSELTARTNDEGWHTVFAEWLKDSHINGKDAVFVFSVGGGSKEKDLGTDRAGPQKEYVQP